MNPLKLIVTTALMASVLPALAQDKSAAPSDKMEQCLEMQKKMQAEMKERDAELDKLVSAMNSAEGSKKADAIAAVVNKLVEQRKEMHDKMMGMMGKMMQCTAGGQMGKGCPMMEGTKEKEKGAPATPPEASPSAR